MNNLINSCNPLYETKNGAAYVGDSIELMRQIPDSSIDLIMTSPPFALQRKKKYGNAEESDYVNWLIPFAQEAFRILKDTGSFVIDLGGAYLPKTPSRSLYNFRVLIALCDDVGFSLAEDFYWFNPSKLPSPIEWVNKRKIRVKDSVNTIWWLSKGNFPKANVSNVLKPYSERMKQLLKDPEKFYTPKNRPSGHSISDKFSNNNGGSIPSNLLSYSNSDSNSSYFKYCKMFNVERHPARFPADVPQFFINFLTEKGDVVLDIFAGSNTTGFVAEKFDRKWLSFEINKNYLATSYLRFADGDSIENVQAKVEKMLGIEITLKLATTKTSRLQKHDNLSNYSEKSLF
ncbi:MAG: hypothetical protein QG673_1827 [Pseudomonadota bacterium]|nr:hypothetical protein [Pseudomonadota bacterium]